MSKTGLMVTLLTEEGKTRKTAVDIKNFEGKYGNHIVLMNFEEYEVSILPTGNLFVTQIGVGRDSILFEVSQTTFGNLKRGERGRDSCIKFESFMIFSFPEKTGPRTSCTHHYIWDGRRFAYYCNDVDPERENYKQVTNRLIGGDVIPKTFEFLYEEAV